jgi:hypothetical protein
MRTTETERVLDEEGNPVRDDNGDHVERPQIIGGDYHEHIRRPEERSRESLNVLEDDGIKVSKKGDITLDPKKWTDEEPAPAGVE